jgi:hypothetical protein
VLDDAFEAFIDVLDRYTIADMLKGQAPAAATRRKSTQAARAPASRRTLHGSG